MNFIFKDNRILNCFFAALVLSIGCTNVDEEPLNLRVGAEPSAKTRNDKGIEHFKKGRNFDALLQFNQANLADPTSGEIHFNLGLALWNENKKKRAIQHFKKAQQLAQGNPKILQSKLIKKVLKEN